MASGTRFDRPISAIFFRASSWERRAEVQAPRTRQPSKRTCCIFCSGGPGSHRYSLPSVLTSNKLQVKLLFFDSMNDIVVSRPLLHYQSHVALLEDVLA